MKSPFLILIILTMVFIQEGCVRLKGGMGYTSYDNSEQISKRHGVGFDTQNLIPGRDTDAEIEIVES